MENSRATINEGKGTRVSGETRKVRRTPRRTYARAIGVLSHGRYEVFQATQLSEGGIGFMAKKEFVAGDMVVISLIVPGGGVVVARGQILQGQGLDQTAEHAVGQLIYGVKFIDMSLPLRRLIRNYVTAKTQAEVDLETGDKQKNDAA